MKSTIHIDPKYIIGKTFTSTIDPNVSYTCIGYIHDGRLFFIGARSDNGTSKTYSFLAQDVTFSGDITI